jgi:hypothetical protein
MAGTREYNGVVFGPQRSSEVIRARSLEGAKAQMKKKHGAETDESGVRRWVCGLAPQSFTGRPAK